MIIYVAKYNINVELLIKKNKNTYLRFLPQLVKITTPNKEYLEVDKLEKLLANYEDKITRLCFVSKKNVFHLFGNEYNLIFKLAKKNSFSFEGLNLNIFTKKDDLVYYRKITKKILEISLLEKFYDIFNECFNRFKIIANYQGDCPKIKLGHYKSFYGRCVKGKDNYIEFNYYLAKFPLEYLKLTIYHELCHLIYMNHQRDFHVLLDTLYNNERLYAKEMKKLARIYSMDLV